MAHFDSTCRLCLSFLVFLLGTAFLSAQDEELSHAETFALATDRSLVIENLAPGSAEALRYRILERQHALDFAGADRLLKIMAKKFSDDDWLLTLANRQLLLNFEADPNAAYAAIAKKLRLRFDAAAPAGVKDTSIANKLDPSLIAWPKLSASVLKTNRGRLHGFTESGLRRIDATKLKGEGRRDFLRRQRTPDHPDLIDTLIADFKANKNRQWGDYSVQHAMTRRQLEECRLRLPRLGNSQRFVRDLIRQVLPEGRFTTSHDRSLRLKELVALEELAQSLGPVFEGFKARVLHRRLLLDEELDARSQARFLRFLTMPIAGQTLANETYHDECRKRGTLIVDFRMLGVHFDSHPAQDQDLITRYLTHFFAKDIPQSTFARYINAEALTRIYAEARLLSGDRDYDRLSALLPSPEVFENIRKRVEISFRPENKDLFTEDESIVLDVDVKNVKDLAIRIFDIDTDAFFHDHTRAIDFNLNLEGIAPTWERQVQIDASPFLRLRQTIGLPELKGPGVAIVELIGNGFASRALIRRGELFFTDRIGAAGHYVHVLNTRGEIQTEASLRMGSREFTSDDQGLIIIPFGTTAGQKSLLLRSGKLRSRRLFRHQRERYSLKLSAFIDRESLSPGREVPLVLRADLLNGGAPLSVGALKDVEVTVFVKGRDEARMQRRFKDVKLHDAEESVLSFRVPEDVAVVQVRLEAKIESLTQQDDVILKSAYISLPFNDIRRYPLPASPLLRRSSEGYTIEVRGRNGELVADHIVPITLKHRDLKKALSFRLKTGKKGLIPLGPLKDFDALSFTDLPQGFRDHSLIQTQIRRPKNIHLAAKETLRLAWPHAGTTLSRQDLAFYRQIGSRNDRDLFGELKLSNAQVVVKDLDPGRYQINLKNEHRSINVIVAPRKVSPRLLADGRTILQRSARTDLVVRSLATDAEDLLIEVLGATPRTRVHVLGARYRTVHRFFESLSTTHHTEPKSYRHVQARSAFASKRPISSEYRYILDRRRTRLFPGNMLERPGLILNPFIDRESESDRNGAIGLGGGAGGRGGGRTGGPSGGAARPAKDKRNESRFADLDFLPERSQLMMNAKLDAKGRLRIPWKALGSVNDIHVLVCDGQQSHATSIQRPWSPLTPVDRRMSSAFASNQAQVEEREIEFLSSQETRKIPLSQRPQIETYRSLADVYNFYRGLGTAEINRFEPLTRWNALDAKVKLKFYAEHAGHELHVFLKQKDPKFFEDTVRPYLENKATKTFLDEWLLDRALESWMAPGRFDRLNIVEKILLTRSVEGQEASGRAFVKDRFDRLPANRDRDAMLFGTALRLKSLTSSNNLGLYFADEDQRLPSPKKSNFARNKPRGNVMEEEDEEDEAREEYSRIFGIESGAKSDSRVRFPSDWEVEKKRRARAPRGFFREVDRTRALRENNYWQLSPTKIGPQLITVNAFWLDFARSDSKAPFVSTKFAEASRNVTEILLALAFLDLPFEAEDAVFEKSNGTIGVTAKTSMLLVTKKMVEVAPPNANENIILRRFIIDPLRPHNNVKGERIDRFVDGPLLRGKVYNARVVVTNASAERKRLEVLRQIPVGALPLQSTRNTQVIRCDLKPYRTTIREYAFYFPQAGSFAHASEQANIDGRCVALSPKITYEVLAARVESKMESWADVAERGSSTEVLAMLKTQNLSSEDLSRITWRLRDLDFFKDAIAILRARHIHHEVTWSFGLHHGDQETSREYLAQLRPGRLPCGSYLRSPLVNHDLVSQSGPAHLEFAPLFNARAHAFEGFHRIEDPVVKASYGALLSDFCFRPKLGSQSWMRVTYHMLLQDRVDDALKAFEKVDRDQVASKLQFDAMQMHLAFFEEDFEKARALAMKHSAHPVARWRQRFLEALRHLDEAQGKVTVVEDGASRDARLTKEADAASHLIVKITDAKIDVQHRNIEKVTVNIFPVDLELLFSRRPFADAENQSVAYVRPAYSKTFDVDSKSRASVYKIPEDFATKNMIIEVRGGGLRRRTTMFARRFVTEISENQGMLRVVNADAKKPLSKVYVKVFAESQSGQVSFHKDGYTDLRGRFDYVSLSSPLGSQTKRFSILVTSSEEGAEILQVNAPTQ